jgi:hypothetical protein
LSNILGWTLGLGLSAAGAVGIILLLLNWSGFTFGYHYVGLNIWSFLLVFSLVLLYVGAVVLWSTVKTSRNLRG